MPTITDLNLVGTAGEYYVCAELCRQGYLALLTPKNNPLFDVVATNQQGTRSVSIQVKTRSIKNQQGWKLNSKITSASQNSPLFVVLVTLKQCELPDFRIYEHNALSNRISEVYNAYITKPKKDGTAKKEVSFRWFDEVSFTAEDKLRLNNWEPITKKLSDTGG